MKNRQPPVAQMCRHNQRVGMLVKFDYSFCSVSLSISMQLKV
jgi:hypothetical protein